MSSAVTIVQQGAFSRHYHLSVDGRLETDLDLSTVRCKGSFQYNGVDYKLLKRGGLYTLEGNGRSIVQARKTFWTDRFSFELVDRHFTLKKKGVFRSTVFLIENDIILGTLSRSGFLRRHVHG